MSHIRAFFHIPPSQNDHHPAIRCALGVGIPLFALHAAGRLDLMVFAALGAFTGVFGRGEPHRSRFSHQWRAGSLLLAAVVAGLSVSLLDLPAWVMVIATAAVGGLSFGVASFGRLIPSGSLFYVFAFSATAFMPAPASFVQATGVAVASVLLSLFIGVAGRALPGHHTPWIAEPRAMLSVAERREVYLLSVLHAAAIAISGGVAMWVGQGHTYWAMIASTVPLVAPSAAHGVARGVHRILGTIGGLLLAGLLFSIGLTGWLYALVIVVLQFLVELFVTRHYALAQMFVTPLALLLIEVAQSVDPWVLARDRGVETLIGASVGITLVALSAVPRKVSWRRSPRIAAAGAGPRGGRDAS